MSSLFVSLPLFVGWRRKPKCYIAILLKTKTKWRNNKFTYMFEPVHDLILFYPIVLKLVHIASGTEKDSHWLIVSVFSSTTDKHVARECHLSRFVRRESTVTAIHTTRWCMSQCFHSTKEREAVYKKCEKTVVYRHDSSVWVLTLRHAGTKMWSEVTVGLLVHWSLFARTWCTEHRFHTTD